MRHAWVKLSLGLLAWNYVRHLTGKSTWCSDHREALHTDTRRGRLIFMAGFLWFAYWFPGHFLKTPQAPTNPGPDHA